MNVAVIPAVMEGTVWTGLTSMSVTVHKTTPASIVKPVSIVLVLNDIRECLFSMMDGSATVMMAFGFEDGRPSIATYDST